MNPRGKCFQRWLLPTVLVCAAGAVGCASLKPASTYARSVSHAWRDTEATPLGKAYASAVSAHAGESGFYVLSDNAEDFRTRLALIEVSTRAIDFQIYLLQGQTGLTLSRAVMQAADRGVRVRVLLDGYHLDSEAALACALAGHHNVEVRLFNPLPDSRWGPAGRLLEASENFDRFNHRMHNKCMTFDGTVAVVGGRNAADEYFGAADGFAFRDFGLVGVGPVVDKLGEGFDEYWNSDFAYPIEAARLTPRPGEDLSGIAPPDGRKPWPHAPGTLPADSEQVLGRLVRGQLPLLWGKATVICDRPDKVLTSPSAGVGAPVAQILQQTRQARSEAILVSGYFIPAQFGMAAICEARSHGVHVTVLTNSLASTDLPLVHAYYRHYRKPLLAEHVELHELRAVLPKPRDAARPRRYELHAKLYLFDRRRVVLGSMNLDPRSAYLDTETAIVIDSPALADDLFQRVERILRLSRSWLLALRPECTLFGTVSKIVWLGQEDEGDPASTDEPEVSPWRRFDTRALGLLPFEGEL